MARITQIAADQLYQSQATLDAGQALGDTVQGATGKEFVRVYNGAVALVVGDVIQSPALDTNFNDLVVVSCAKGSNVLIATLGTGESDITANEFQGGSVVVSTGTGAGQERTIIANTAAADETNVTLTLDAPLAVALDITSTVTLRNLYNGVIQAPASTLTGTPVGVAVFAIPANQYGWLQVEGECGVLSDSTSIIAGSEVSSPSGTAGACTLQVAGLPSIGSAVQAASSTKFITVKLDI